MHTRLHLAAAHDRGRRDSRVSPGTEAHANTRLVKPIGRTSDAKPTAGFICPDSARTGSSSGQLPDKQPFWTSRNGPGEVLPSTPTSFSTPRKAARVVCWPVHGATPP